MELVRINTARPNETYSKIRIGNNLSRTSPIQMVRNDEICVSLMFSNYDV
jgi:hypothetical protein